MYWRKGLGLPEFTDYDNKLEKRVNGKHITKTACIRVKQKAYNDFMFSSFTSKYNSYLMAKHRA